MFQPASLKGDSPTPVDERIRKKYFVLYIIIIILSFLPLAFFEIIYVNLLWKDPYLWLFFLLIPLNLLITIYITTFGALVISGLFLIIIKLIYPPKEGIFKRSPEDRDYLFWNIRNYVKKWPLWISTTNPFPWFKNRFVLRFFGVKIGKHTICDNSWISSEFITVGDDVIIGMNSTVLSFGIEQDKFIIKRISIDDGATIGAKCVLLPGTVVKKDAKLSGHSYTDYNQVLNEDSIYSGHPAKIQSG